MDNQKIARNLLRSFHETEVYVADLKQMLETASDLADKVAGEMEAALDLLGVSDEIKGNALDLYSHALQEHGDDWLENFIAEVTEKPNS